MARLTWHSQNASGLEKHRGIDFASWFAGEHAIACDDRHDYGETRYVVTGFPGSRLVVAAFVVRGEWFRVISMRKASRREKASFSKELSENPQD